MMSLIDQLLDVTRLEGGQLTPSLQEEDMTQLLREKIETFMPQSQAGHKTISVAKTPQAVYVRMDKELISRVLDNLISNALKYTEPNGHITLCAIPNGDTAIIQVIDDGEGIPKEVAAQIFNKFYQIKDTDGRPLRRGTGLSLSFCKLVLEAHNGRIWVESTAGEGSAFYGSLGSEGVFGRVACCMFHLPLHATCNMQQNLLKPHEFLKSPFSFMLPLTNPQAHPPFTKPKSSEGRLT